MMVSRWIAAAAICTVVFAADVPYQAHAAGQKVGTVIDQVLSTDIQAFVNGKQIPSMNIRGYTAVTAEDLRSYGYDVSWSPYARQLRISEAAGRDINEKAAPSEQAALPDGAKLKDVLYTDIQSFYVKDGKEYPLPSYNIDGSTAVMLNDLETYGRLDWDEAKRTLSLQSESFRAGKQPDNTQAQPQALQVKQTSAVARTIDFRDGTMYDGEAKVGFGEDGLPFFSLNYFGKTFGYQVSRSGKVYTIDGGLYSFELSPGSLTAKTYWGSELDNQFELIRAPQVKDGQIYIYSIDMERLFGYTALWNQEESKLDIRYDQYDVQDYGLPAVVGGDRLKVTGTLLESAMRGYTTKPISLSLDNMGLLYNMTTAAAAGQKMQDDMHVSLADCDIALAMGLNRIKETLKSGERILYKSAYDVSTDFAQFPFSVDIEGFKLDGAAQGLVQSDSAEPEFTGTSKVPFNVQVFKWDERSGYLRPAPQQEINPDESGRYVMPLHLTQGPGLYKVNVSLSEWVATPRSGAIKAYFDKGHFYVKVP